MTELHHPPKSRLLAMLKRLAMATVAIAGLVGFLAWMGGAFHHKVPPGVVPIERPSATGRILVVVEKSVEPETITAVGSVQPRRKTDVASQLLAKILEIKPRPGDRVKAGDVIITLDDRELLAQSREATANIATTEADLVTRKSDFERAKKLRDSNSVSAEELNRVEGAFKVAETQVQRAKASVGRIEVMLTYTKIVATSDGLVADRFADPGDLASPGKTLLAIYDPNDLELHANVPESLASGLSVGQSLAVRIDANRYLTTAKIREIVPQAQQASRSVLVKLALPQQSANPILPGMFGRTTIPVGQTDRLFVPKSAVMKIGQLDLVEVADDEGKLARRFVRLGREADDKIEILSGLTAGERVALPAGESAR